jgi:hypothetical protein
VDGDEVARLDVVAVHGNAMLTRLTALLGPHPIGAFAYRAGTDGLARVVVEVGGGDRQADRVAARLRRVVGVLDVGRQASSSEPSTR